MIIVEKVPSEFSGILKHLGVVVLLAACLSTAGTAIAQQYDTPMPFGSIGVNRPSDFYVTDVDVDSLGNVYLADVLHLTVGKYTPAGELIFSIADPAFKWPRTLSIDDSGRIYVLDNVVGQIRVYSSVDGTFIDAWSGYKCAGELEVDVQGRILVAMNGNIGCGNPRYEVIGLDSTGAEVFSFGEYGKGPGQFDHNYGITTGLDGSIVVVDEGNVRYQVFDAAGVFQYVVGKSGLDQSEFKAPRSAAIDSLGNIYINDRRNYRIQKFDANGTFLDMWGQRGRGDGEFYEADGLEIGPDNSVWVAGYHGNDIQRFDVYGNLVERWRGHISGPGEFFDVKGIGVVDGMLLAVDGFNQRVQVFDSTTGDYLWAWGERAQGEATVFNFPRSLATGPAGDVYVNDDDHIRRISPDGTFVKRYPRLSGVRSASLGIAVSDEGIIFQSDTGNHRINKIDSNTGNLLLQWGIEGSDPGQFKKPNGISIGPNGNIFVVDNGNSRIQIFDQEGQYLDEWNSLGGVPRGIKIDKDRGIVYIGEWKRVAAYDLSGNFLFKMTGEGTPLGRFDQSIYDIALDDNGNIIYAADVYKGIIYRYAFPSVVQGIPQYAAGQELGLFIWQDADDGEWHIRFSGEQNKAQTFSVEITASNNFVDARPYSFEATNDELIVDGTTIDLSGRVYGGVDGADFFLSGPGSLSFSVSVDGQTQDIGVYIGGSEFNPLVSDFDLLDQSGDLRPPPVVDSDDFSPGRPSYIAGTARAVFLWKDTFDGPYQLRASNGSSSDGFAISLVSNTAINGLTPVQLGSGGLEQFPNGFSLDSGFTIGLESGVDFNLLNSSKALISVSSTTTVEPLVVGANSGMPATEGWVIQSTSLPLDSGNVWGLDPGVSITRDSGASTLLARAVGDLGSHNFYMALYSMQPVTGVLPFSLEGTEQAITSGNVVEVSGAIYGAGVDGMNVSVDSQGLVGISYLWDGIFAPENSSLAQIPNAYQLPQAKPIGAPEYNPAIEEGLFVWKKSGKWHVRVTGGGRLSTRRYVGSISSDQPITSPLGISLENNDILDVSVPQIISFDLSAYDSWEDGFEFVVSDSANISLNLVSPSTGGAEIVFIGEKKWPVENLPVDIGG